ncbi:MAG: GIY-YIG nuclease family protein [Chloroflexi bacterium]|nr:GIY-YIG nuclease family protein [Chloroflexota bacterium]
MFWVYVLRSEKTGRRYTGSCAGVAERLRRHNAGHSPATRHGVPWVVVHAESHPTRATATARQRSLKTGRGRAELDRLLTSARSR